MSLLGRAKGAICQIVIYSVSCYNLYLLTIIFTDNIQLMGGSGGAGKGEEAHIP